MARTRLYRGNFSAGIIDVNFQSRTDAEIRYQGASRIVNMLVHPQGGVKTLNNVRRRPNTSAAGETLIATDRLYFDDNTIRTIRYYEGDGTSASFRIRDEETEADQVITATSYINREDGAKQISAVAFSNVIWVFSPRFGSIRIPVERVISNEGTEEETTTITFGDSVPFERSAARGRDTDLSTTLIYNNQPAVRSIQILSIGGLLNLDAHLIISLDGIPSGRISLNQVYAEEELVFEDAYTRAIESALLQIPAISQLGIDVSYHDPGSSLFALSLPKGFTNERFSASSFLINDFFNSISASLPYPNATPGLVDRQVNINFATPGRVSALQVEIIDNRGSGARVQINEYTKGIDENVVPNWFETLPEIATLFQNRLYTADQTTNRGHIIASQIDLFSVFGNRSSIGGAQVINDDSPFQAEINARAVPIIYHYIAGRSLFVFTSLGIWAVNTQGAITPSTISVYKFSERVADRNIKPIEISGRIFFLEEGRPNLRMIEYNERIDNFEVRSVSQTFTEQLKGLGQPPVAMCLYKEDEADYIAISFEDSETIHPPVLMILVQPEDDLFAPSLLNFRTTSIYCDEERGELILSNNDEEIVIGGASETLTETEYADPKILLYAWVELLPMAIQPEEREVISGLITSIDDITIHFSSTTELYYGFRTDKGVGKEFRDVVGEKWQPLKDNPTILAPYTGSVKLPKLQSNEGNIRVILGVKDPNATLYIAGIEVEVSWN